MKADDAKRLKELERENARLKRIVADQALDIDGGCRRFIWPHCGRLIWPHLRPT
jgi:hypothetical protein